MNWPLWLVLLLAIPIAWTAAFFMVLGARARLASLESRFAALERRMVSALAEISGGVTRQPATPPAEPEPAAPPAWAGQTESTSGPPAPPQASVPPIPPPLPVAETEPAVPLPPSGELAARTAQSEDVRATEPAIAAASAQSEPSSSEDAAAAAAPPGEPPAGEGVAAPPPPHPPREVGFEEMLGTRWVVWVGGVALALGAIFLVRYTIEQGLIGPGARIVLGALFAAALIAAGEWTRRQEALSGVPGLPQASIPAILTAAGTTAAYATVWAAYGLYAFIGAGAAFVLLGIVALATLAAALLHGPALAGVGLIGAYVTPLLIRSVEPNFWALYIYLAVVTAAAFLLARIRMWRWLALAAVGLSLVWFLPGLQLTTIFRTAPDVLNHLVGQAFIAPHVFHLVVGYALAAVLIVAGLLYGPENPDEQIDEVSCIALGGYLLASAVLAIATHHDGAALAGFTLLTFATVAIAWRTTAVAWTLPIAAIVCAYVIGQWSLLARQTLLLGPLGGFASGMPVPMGADLDVQVGLGAAFAALFGIAGFLAQGRYARALIAQLWAGAAVLAPLAILIALYYRIAGFERSIPLAFVAIVLAALFASATEVLARRAPRPGSAAAQAFFATGAVAALALALTFALEQGWLTVAFALMAPGIAMVADKRPLPFLRWLVSSIATLVCVRVLWQPQIARDLGTTPIFNWLLWGYGVPAASFWIAGHILRRRADDQPARTLDAAAILFTVLTVTLEIRHYVTGGFIYLRAPSPLTEFGLDASALAALSIGLERLRQRTRSIVHEIGAALVAALAMIVAVGGLLFFANPLFSRQEIGGLFINEILLAYAMPALLFAVAGELRRRVARDAVASALEAVAIVFAVSFAVLEVRHAIHGEAMQFWQGADLGELGVDVAILAAVAIGLDWLRQRTRSIVHDAAASFVALLAVVVGVLGPLLFANPLLEGQEIGGPFVNLILLAYALPAVLFGVGGALRGRTLTDKATRVLDAAAIVFAVAYVLIEIRYLVHSDTMLLRRGVTLTEVGLDVSALLAIAIGLEWWRLRSLNAVHDLGAEAVAALALAFVVFGLLAGVNPLFVRQDVGGLFVNLLMLAYGLPAIMAIALALFARGARPMSYRAVAAGAAVVLTLAYLTLQVRRFYQGPFIDQIGGGQGTSDAELWTYSVVWLAYGVILLLAGIVLRSPPARLASALMILVTVLKVFLYDLAGIGGVWRALSFIGLGLVLVGIGWIYQKLLFPPKPPEREETPAPA